MLRILIIYLLIIWLAYLLRRVFSYWKKNEDKKKNIALKASKFESDKESDFEDKDIIMIARKFRRFFEKPNERRRFKDSKNKKKGKK